MKRLVYLTIMEGQRGARHGTSLVVLWLRLHAPNAGGLGSIPGGETRSRMHAATKSSNVATKKSCMPQRRPGAA